MAKIDIDHMLVPFMLRLADDHLILGHRLSQWCGHAPMLEEDLAMPNMALDLIGQARALYDRAGQVENKGRGEDDFAYRRREREYLNCRMVARPNGDFAHTMLRQLIFAARMDPQWRAMTGSAEDGLAAIACRAVKENAYHFRHASEWVIRLGDGTPYSAERLGEAAEALGPFVDELFENDAVTAAIASAGIAPEPSSFRSDFEDLIGPVLGEAGLDALPFASYPQTGGRKGLHDENMGHILAELHYLQAAYPGASW